MISIDCLGCWNIHVLILPKDTLFREGLPFILSKNTLLMEGHLPSCLRIHCSGKVIFHLVYRYIVQGRSSSILSKDTLFREGHLPFYRGYFVKGRSSSVLSKDTLFREGHLPFYLGYIVPSSLQIHCSGKVIFHLI